MSLTHFYCNFESRKLIEKLADKEFPAVNWNEIFEEGSCLSPKSLYISHTVSNFYETEIEIWAGFGFAWQY